MDLKENRYLSISAQCWCLNRDGAEEADRFQMENDPVWHHLL